jgi:uncharacterized protein involved in exopolysaccharide biosynthesis
LPESDKSKLSGLSGLSELASIAGVGGSEASPVKLYPAILKSESVLKSVILKKYKTSVMKDSTNLIKFWEIDEKTPELSYDVALKNLRDCLEVSIDMKTSIISISLETSDPQISADIINSITSELDKFMRTKRTTNANKQRIWIEIRLGEVKEDLTNSEERIKIFREKNRSIGTSPALLLEQERLLREVQINSALYAELKKQYELIKIEEIKNTPIVNVMDVATPAPKKEHPKRGIIVIMSFIFTFVGSCGYIYLKHTYGNTISNMIASIKN